MINSINNKDLPWVGGGAAKTRVAVVGDIILDEYIDGAVSRISPEAPVPVHLVGSEYVTCGGAGNVALNIRTAGGEPLLFGVCGRDEAGAKLLRALRENAISSDYIVETSERPTTRKTRVRAQQQQLLRIDWERTCPISEAVQDEIISNIKRSDFDVLLISDYGKGGLPDAMIKSLVLIAEERGVPSVVDPKGRNFARYQGATIITPNRKEGLEAIGEDANSNMDRAQIAETLQKKWGLQNVLLTLGSEGMLLWRADEAEGGLHLPTEAREVFDVSGAGDTVAAMISLCLGAGASFVDAIKVANVAAGVVVEKWGTQPIYLNELRASLARVGVPGAQQTADKVRSREHAIATVKAWQDQGKTVVFTNGCFDILHAGHVTYLERARAKGDALVIGLNADASIRRIKGPKRPIVAEDNRALLLAALQFVDLVVVFEEDTPEELIRAMGPDILVKGADWKVENIAGADHVLSRGGAVETIELVPNLSTSAIIAKIVATER